MRFRIAAKIFEDFPEVRIGVVTARGLDNHGSDPAITKQVREAETALVESFREGNVTEHPRIASWREAYRKFGMPTPWQAFAQVRLRIYDKMLADPQVLVDHQWPHNLDLLHDVRRSKCRTGLATMSHCVQTRRVL